MIVSVPVCGFSIPITRKNPSAHPTVDFTTAPNARQQKTRELSPGCRSFVPPYHQRTHGRCRRLGLDKKVQVRILHHVYDLKSGTFDISLLSLDDGGFEVFATTGDTHLSSEDFNNGVIESFFKQYKKKTDTDVSTLSQSSCIGQA